MMRRDSIVDMIRLVASAYGVHPGLAVIIARRESNLKESAIGDHQDAVGLWQWHLASYQDVRAHMGKDTIDRRLDPWESTVTAMFAMGVLHLYKWWTTYPHALDEMKGLPDE